MPKSLTDRIVDLMHSDMPFTDLHVREGGAPQLLTPRSWVADEEGEVPRAEIEVFLDGIEPDWREPLKTGRAMSCAVDLPTMRLRMNVFTTDSGKRLNVSLRRLPPEPMTLKETGLPPTVKEMLDRGRGLILVTGATRSGKTTTLAAMLRAINESRPDHIITIEDPIEYVLRAKQGIISQKEVGSDAGTFLDGLQDALRQSPNVIMIGEVRDAQTADVMLQAAESGHLVLATLHATSAIGAITKLSVMTGAEEAEQQQRRYTLANTLIGVVYQVLLPKLAYDGFVLAAEILANSPPVTKAIEDPSRANVLREQIKRGEDKISRPLNDVLLELATTRKIVGSDALRASYEPMELKARLDQRR